MIRVLKILEISWLVIAIAALVFATYNLYLGDTNNAIIFYIFTMVAAVFWYLRRKRRQALERDAAS